jgi:hypothetical protein
MGKNDPPDFSSKEYWQTRFGRETAFEWLARSEIIVPIVAQTAEDVLRQRKGGASTHRPESQESSGGELTEGRDERREGLRILHFGCGSSNLGSDVKTYLDQHFALDPSTTVEEASRGPSTPAIDIQVIDADYVPPDLLSSRPIPVIQLDVLDPESLRGARAQYGQWDLVIDKSTADAISCGPNLPRSILEEDLLATTPGTLADDSLAGQDVPKGSAVEPRPHGEDLVEPIEVLCANLARVTSKGGKWISISYSASRFAHIPFPGSSLGGTTETANGGMETQRPGWKVLEKRPVASTSMPEGRVVRDGKGFRTVYEPDTPVWIYILERT